MDRTLAGTLMAEFSRVQLIVQEDVGKSLVALRSDLLAACSAFLADVGRIMDVPHADPRLALLEASLERFRRQASLKFDLPLAENGCGRGGHKELHECSPPGIEFLIKATGSHWGGCHSNGSTPQPGMGVGSKPRPGPE